MADAKKRWFSQILQSGIDEELVGASEILAHVTPEIMANHLPPALVSELLRRSLAAGTMNADQVIETLTPELLAQHIPPHILWECVVAAATAAGLTEPGA